MEFDFIERFAAAAPGAPEDQVWIGDDAAILEHGLLLAADALVEGVHFDLSWCSPADAGWKALAVNVSDIAAVGGIPNAAVVSLVAPTGRPALADSVAAGLLQAIDDLDCPIVGGDTTSGPALMVSITVTGKCAGSDPVLRSGAQPDDAVFVTGTLGGPASALEALQTGREPDNRGLSRLRRPMPRVAHGRAAAAAGATAMIDISDGLGADLHHIATASDTGMVVRAPAVPVTPGANLSHALSGGDDYELAFTAPDAERVRRIFAAENLAFPIQIGAVVRDPSMNLEDSSGKTSPLVASGWEHPVAGSDGL